MSIGPRGKVFRDSVHGLIKIEPEDSHILSLLNAPEFQRLRRVRQLGVSSLTYPGATHTRFAHSLGVFNFAQRILAVLRRRYAADSSIVDLLDAKAPVVKAAALLHDLGHGPFSHMIERAFPSIANHEDKTVALIRDNGSIPGILAEHKIAPQDVAELVLKTSEHLFLADIVSSQLDADRMDYILRDALNTGVEYGKFDSEWVLNSLCLGLEPNAPDQDHRRLRLCMEERRGLYSAEQLVMARMHMSFQLYYHRATRGWEAHLLCLLRLASELARRHALPKTTPPHVVRFLCDEGVLENDDWLWFDESAVEAALQQWASAVGGDTDLKDLAHLSRSFLLRQKVFQCAEITLPNTTVSIRLSRDLDKCGRGDIDWLLDDPTFTSYKDYDAGFRSQKPRQDRGAISTGAILVGTGELSDRARPAEAVSRVLEALGRNPDGSRLSLCRLYFREHLNEPIGNILAELRLMTHNPS